MLLFRILLTVACVGAIAYNFRDPTAWSGFHVMRRDALFAAMALVPLLLFLRALKWRTLLRTSLPEATVKQALRSYLGALPLSLVTPGKAGELIRGLYLPQPELRWRIAGLTLVDNWTDFAAAAIWTLPFLYLLGGSTAMAVGGVFIFVISGVPYWIRILHAVSRSVPRQFGIAEKWSRFWPNPKELGWIPPFSAIALGVLAYGIEWTQIACFLKSFGGAGKFLDLAGNLAMAQLANSIQITVAGLGIREGSTAWILGRAGWDTHLALAATMAQTALTLLIPALIGLCIKPNSIAGKTG